MQFDTEASEHLVCAVLAAQVAELRGRIDTGATVDLLWRTADVLSQLSGLVRKLAQRCCESDLELNAQCNIAVMSEVEISRSLEHLAFEQAQRNDFTCQTVDCVVTALERLAITDAPIGARLSPNELAALYVSERQREVHEAATREFVISLSSELSETDSRGPEDHRK
jgi:hypothetical protein